MYGGTVKVAKSRKTKRKSMTEAKYLEDASEQSARKAKKAKIEKAFEATGYEVATIQEEVKDLEADKILPDRTRSGKAATIHSLYLNNHLFQRGRESILLGN